MAIPSRLSRSPGLRALRAGSGSHAERERKSRPRPTWLRLRPGLVWGGLPRGDRLQCANDMRRGKHELVGYVDEPTTNGFAEAIIDEVEVINRFVASTSMHAT